MKEVREKIVRINIGATLDNFVEFARDLAAESEFTRMFVAILRAARASNDENLYETSLCLLLAARRLYNDYSSHFKFAKVFDAAAVSDCMGLLNPYVPFKTGFPFFEVELLGKLTTAQYETYRAHSMCKFLNEDVTALLNNAFVSSFEEKPSA